MLIRPRIIPVLSIINDDLVKTTKFENPKYLGDPINAVKIFNGKRVDELCILDIRASLEQQEPNFPLLKDIAAQAFMPLSYGGGLSTIDHVTTIINMGFEKVVFNTALFNNPSLIQEAVRLLGSSGVVISIDVMKVDEEYVVMVQSGTVQIPQPLSTVVMETLRLGIGEVLINNIDRDGMMSGYDETLIHTVSKQVNVPVIACGGAKDINDFKIAVNAGAQAAAASSMFVFYGAQKTVLITHPNEETIRKLWSNEG